MVVNDRKLVGVINDKRLSNYLPKAVAVLSASTGHYLVAHCHWPLTARAPTFGRHLNVMAAYVMLTLASKLIATRTLANVSTVN